MAKPFSEDLRERIGRAVEAGRSRRAVARMFGVSASCVIKLMRRYRETRRGSGGEVRRLQESDPGRA